MTTSGTSVFDANRDQVIASALRKVGAIAEGDTPTTEQITNGTFMLNTLLKEANADGMPLWAIVERTIPCSAFVNGKVTMGIGQAINIPAPLKVLSAYNRDTSNATTPIDIPLTLLTHYDYNWLSSKYSTGTSVQFFHEPMNQFSNLYIWPIPDSYSIAHREIHITYQRPFQDAGDATNTLDFPPYWTNAIIYQLAWRLAPEYGMPPNDRAVLAKEAMAFWDRALSFGVEEGSLLIAPDWSRMHMGQGGSR